MPELPESRFETTEPEAKLGTRKRRFALPPAAFLLLIFLALWSAKTDAQTLRGAWQGTLNGAGYSVPFTFYLDAAGGGTLLSPDRNFSGPVLYALKGAQVTVQIPSVHATYRATVDGDRMQGSWFQFQKPIPLVLNRKPAPSKPTPAPSPSNP